MKIKVYWNNKPYSFIMEAESYIDIKRINDNFDRWEYLC